jgi:hypothetical protein
MQSTRGRRQFGPAGGGRRDRGGLAAASVPVVLLALALTTASCSTSNGTAGGSATGSTGRSPVATTTESAGGGQGSTIAPAGADLSGTWDGTYDGAYKGTFTLDWQESGTKLSGTIDLPSLGGSVPIDGTVAGDSITFGTVGSTNIQYSGSLSGDSMSGSYKVLGSGGSVGGTWKANRA